MSDQVQQLLREIDCDIERINELIIEIEDYPSESEEYQIRDREFTELYLKDIRLLSIMQKIIDRAGNQE